MLHLILADSELETVPPEIAGHRVVQWQARRRGRRGSELILNSSFHHPAMRRLPDRERRGRPDIVHACSLSALDTPLNREGLLRLYIHTRQNKLITVNPKVRLPRSEHRFIGLMEYLFLRGVAPPEEPLLRLGDSSLRELIEQIRPKRVVTFSERGKPRTIESAFRGLSLEDEVCTIVGGFPHGDFLSDVESISDELIRIDPEVVSAPTVVARTVYEYERVMGIGERRLKGDLYG